MAGGSFPTQFTVVGNRAVFTASTAALGSEVYGTDGTPGGTQLLADILTGPGQSSPRFLTEFQGFVYFSALSTADGHDLWRSDGTPSGTSLFVNVWPGTGNSFPAEFTHIGNELWFAADSPGIGREPWKTNGTVAGTVLVGDINTSMAGGPGSSAPTLLQPFGTGAICSMTGPRHRR